MFSLFDREFSSYWNPNQRSRGLPTISDGEEEEEEAEERERERESVCVCVSERKSSDDTRPGDQVLA